MKYQMPLFASISGKRRLHKGSSSTGRSEPDTQTYREGWPLCVVCLFICLFVCLFVCLFASIICFLFVLPALSFIHKDQI